MATKRRGPAPFYFVSFSTSLFARDGGYLLPLKNAVRIPAGISTGDEVAVEMRIRLGD